VKTIDMPVVAKTVAPTPAPIRPTAVSGRTPAARAIRPATAPVASHTSANGPSATASWPAS
jgi:hypothetical protein